MTFSVILKSCDKLLIGKTYFKSVVQPRVLSAAAVVVWTKEERKQLQGGDRNIISGGKGHEDEAKVCKLHGKHCKWAAGSYF